MPRLVFKNITYKTSEQAPYDAGTLLTAANFNDYFETNEFVEYVLFDHPRELAVNPVADPSQGFVTKTPAQATHLETSKVTLLANPEPGYRFARWEGLNADDPPADATANPITIRVLENRLITATFGLADTANPVDIRGPKSGSWTVPLGVYSVTFEAWGVAAPAAPPNTRPAPPT